MKKISFLLAALLMTLCFAGCTEYRKPGGDNPDNPGTSKPGPDNPENPDTPYPEDAFTVSLKLNGEKFIPSDTISAYWYDLNGFEIYSSEFNSEGVAVQAGLDGDYRVTLSELPVFRDSLGKETEYTYNPNAYTATNDKKNIEIILYEVSPTSGDGSDYYTNAKDIDTYGKAYRATVDRPGQTIFFRYTPQGSGVYSLQTFVDVSANVINPVLYVYLGTVGYVNPDPIDIIDDGGEVNSYTKNIRWEMKIAGSYVGNKFIFAIRADGLNSNAFPIDIDFFLDKDGEHSDDDPTYEPVDPEEDFTQAERESDSFRYVAYLSPARVLEGSLFKLWKKEDGGDGYYHFYDEETDTYGKKIYAKVSRDCEVFETDSRSGFTDGRISKRLNGKNYSEFITQYAQYANTDGAYPVTEELKTFLQDYSCSQALFNDGNGIGETPDINPDTNIIRFPGYSSSEQNQWLFACGYYA